jgi:hypothetical protein
MKKTFKLTHPKIKYARLVESVRCDIKRYVKRERRRELPEGSDFWDFDCKFGDIEAEASVVPLNELSKCISDAEERKLESFYVEILRRPAQNEKRPDAPPEEKRQNIRQQRQS